MTLNKERNQAFIGVGLWLKMCFGSTYVAEQHMFSMSPSILDFILFNLRVPFFLGGGRKIGYF